MIGNQKIKIYWVPPHKGSRESWLINQGLVNNPRVKLVDSEAESDFVFQFYYCAKHRHHHIGQNFPSEKLVLIDYHDNPNWYFPIDCLAYFKRSWVGMVDKGDYTTKKLTPKPANFHPITFAIIDEFIISEKMDRDIVLSCTLREGKQKHFNRIKLLGFMRAMDIRGKKQIGEFNGGRMGRWLGHEMMDYFKMLKRSQIVVTCNPSKWEGDHRTWEAFANGALVFVDKMFTPLVHPLIDGEHCIFFDLSDTGLRMLRELIYYYIKHTEEASRIARAGHEFTMKYHRTSNRIDEILEVIT